MTPFNVTLPMTSRVLASIEQVHTGDIFVTHDECPPSAVRAVDRESHATRLLWLVTACLKLLCGRERERERVPNEVSSLVFPI